MCFYLLLGVASGNLFPTVFNHPEFAVDRFLLP